MLEKIIEQLILLKPFIVVTLSCTAVICLILYISFKRFSWQNRGIKFFGFFYGLNIAETIVLAVTMMKLFLVISLLFGKGRIAMVHIVFYGVLVLIYNLCTRKIKNMIVSIFNGAVIMGVLFVANLLMSYLRDVLFEWTIAIALALMAIFLILYALYDVAQCVLAVVEEVSLGKLPKIEKKDKKTQSKSVE